ncbi:hypothetical protein [Bradyrhizobium sp. McL0615]|uniref:hypothetical protein n=1 Tax=Bradyrhizobium sp. McL0615 TaxID=3415673 RepID=UPI003CE8BDB6
MVVRALPAIVAAVPDVHYLIVGKGDSGRPGAIASDLGVSDRLTVINYVKAEDLLAIFALCDVYVRSGNKKSRGFRYRLPRSDGLSRTERGGQPGWLVDAVTDQPTGIVVDSTDVLAIKRAIIRLLSNEEESLRMGMAGQGRVCREFRKRTINSCGSRSPTSVSQQVTSLHVPFIKKVLLGVSMETGLSDWGPEM